MTAAAALDIDEGILVAIGRCAATISGLLRWATVVSPNAVEFASRQGEAWTQRGEGRKTLSGWARSIWGRLI